jgi:hypothetical protein
MRNPVGEAREAREVDLGMEFANGDREMAPPREAVERRKEASSLREAMAEEE